MSGPESDRNTGIGLIVGGAAAGGFSAVLFWLSTQVAFTVGLIVFGCITALLAVYLIGYGIKKVATAGSTT
jgi:high-affinity Fe2+/Pb2+ permease